MSEEQYFCGGCRRFQLASKGEKCIHCGRLTISLLNNESEQAATNRWKKLHGR